MFRPLLLLPSPHKKINELETRSASLTACYREPIRPRLLLVWSLLIAGSCWSHAHGNPIYSVTGLAVGSRVQFDSEAYHEYRSANCGQLLVARSWQSDLFRDRTSGGKPSSIR